MTATFFRSPWTCGRYNAAHHVAIMYNLIAGYSFFFEDYSAEVIGEILKVRRNGCISLTDISQATRIAEESLSPFLELLESRGLLSQEAITEENAMRYRSLIAQARRQELSIEKSVKEKLPMDITSAEMAYSDAIDDGTTIASVLFELTYRCSEMCIHCYNPGATRNDKEISHRGDLKELDLDDYKRIIDELYELGLVKVSLSGGDPFSKSIVWDILDYLYQKEIAVDILTNGLRLENAVRRLADYYPRTVGVSIYSGLSEDHDAITRVPGSWNRSMQVVKELSELAIPMFLKCCIMQPNLHSYYLVSGLARQYGALAQYEINITESNDGDICAKQLRLTEEQLQVVLRDSNIALYVGKEAPNYGGQKRDLSTCSCGAAATGFCVSPDGNLHPCPAFPMYFGNLKTETALDILKNSEVLKQWRNATVAQYEECGQHDYCDYCNLCAGVNYTEHGDYRKAAETNCYMAKCRFNLAQKLMKEGDTISQEEFVSALQSLPKAKVELHRQYHTKG